MARDLTSAFRMRAAPAHLAACLVLLAAAPARAEILLDGTPASIRLEVTRATVGEVLAVFGERYGVRYRAAILLDRPITGSYSGPLVRVLARVLEGYDYVTRVSPDVVDIAYIRTRGGAAPARTVASAKRVDLPIEVGRLQK
jgi:hypothetical protein